MTVNLLHRKTTRIEFEHFVRDEGDGLRRTAFLITWDLGEAEDLVQECLLRVAKRWPAVHAMERPAAYARRVLVNVALDRSNGRRRRRREVELTGDAGTESSVRERSDGGGVSLETRDELLQAIGSLPTRQRTVLVLRFFEDLSEAQIAEVLGCTRGTVKSTTARGLNRVREALEQSGQADPINVSEREGGSHDDRSA